MTELTAQQAAERLEAALRESTPGRWCKGQTTHHTVAKFTDGKRPYPIAEFHHAIDAEFTDRCHELLPILLAERRELLARQADPIDMTPERVEKQAENRQVPEGWVLVPLEPTPKMLGAWKSPEQRERTAGVYRAMLAAAPKAGDPV